MSTVQLNLSRALQLFQAGEGKATRLKLAAAPDASPRPTRAERGSAEKPRARSTKPPAPAPVPPGDYRPLPPDATKTMAYDEALKVGQQNQAIPGRKAWLTAQGPGFGVDPTFSKPVDASRFRKDLSLREYQELRKDLLLQMRLHPEQANTIYGMAERLRGNLPAAYQKNFETFLGLRQVSGMTQGALEWQRQLCTQQSSKDPEHPTLYDARGLTDYQAYAWWGGDKAKMQHHLWGRGGKVDLDRALTNAYRIPPELLMDYLAELDHHSGLR